jgi:hypothetical protein
MFIPRFIYPNKPTGVNFEFPHRYGLTPRNNYIILIADPIPEELYANFGLWGIVFGSLLFGVIYRSVHASFVHPAMGLGALVSAIYILSQFFRVEWEQAMVLGGVLYSLPLLALVNFVMSAGDLSLGRSSVGWNNLFRNPGEQDA